MPQPKTSPIKPETEVEELRPDPLDIHNEKFDPEDEYRTEPAPEPLPPVWVDGSLRKLAGLRRPRKVFVHVNNTNPILDESGPEYGEVRAAGWEVAEDGWSFDL